MPTDESRVVVVRAGLIWWVTTATVFAINVLFVVAFGSGAATPTDLISATLVGGTLFAVVAAITTSTISIAGPTLRATGIVRVTEIQAGALAAIDDRNGLSLQFLTGRRLTMCVCQPSLAQDITGNKRRRHEADRLRSWLLTAPIGDRIESRWRIEVLILVPVWVAISLGVSLLIHTLTS